MKRHSFVVITVILMVLSGCASSGGKQFAKNTHNVVDHEYVNQINTNSKRIYANIVWVHPRTKRVAIDGETSD